MALTHARPTSTRRRLGLLVSLGSATVAIGGAMASFEKQMKSTGGPGIIPFELAGSPDAARRIMEKWGPSGQAAARRSLVCDQLFLAAYASTLSVGAATAGDSYRRRGRVGLGRLAPAVSRAAALAGLCDLVENLSLLGVISGRIDGPLPRLAQRFAQAKFALLLPAVSYSVGAALQRAHRRTSTVVPHHGYPWSR